MGFKPQAFSPCNFPFLRKHWVWAGRVAALFVCTCRVEIQKTTVLRISALLAKFLFDDVPEHVMQCCNLCFCWNLGAWNEPEHCLETCAQPQPDPLSTAITFISSYGQEDRADRPSVIPLTLKRQKHSLTLLYSTFLHTSTHTECPQARYLCLVPAS